MSWVGALTHFSCKLGLKKIFTALGGSGAPTAPPGYAYVTSHFHGWHLDLHDIVCPYTIRSDMTSVNITARQREDWLSASVVDHTM